MSTKKVFPTLCSNSRFSDCFSSSTAIKGENSAQCSLTWKKVKVERFPFSGNRFSKNFKTPSPLLLLPPLLTSQSNQVDSPPPCSYISMTKYAKYRTLFTKLAVTSVQNRFVGRSVSCQWLTIGQQLPCPGGKSVHTVHTFAGTYILSAGGYVACPCFCVLYDLHQNHCGAPLVLSFLCQNFSFHTPWAVFVESNWYIIPAVYVLGIICWLYHVKTV